MKPYQIVIPTKVYYGRNIWKEALREQESLLRGNVMIVTTGRSLRRLGYVDEVYEQILQCVCGGRVTVFDGISANPRLSEVRSGICAGQQEKVDVIVGFGGGSAIDAAKAIAAGVKEKEGIEALFYRGKEPGTESLPVIAIPTTAGTGSELSKAAIITDEVKKIKNGIRGNALYPLAAIVDSWFTESVPFRTTMETGFDVLAHAVESYVSRAASSYTRMQSETAVRITGKYLPRLAENLSDVEARERMSFASMIMGINLGNASTCLPHRLQYPIGAHTDTSHGAGLAALFTAWIRCEYQYAAEQIERVLKLLTGKNVKGAQECAQTICRFIRSLGLAVSLQGIGVDHKQLPVMAKEVSGSIGNDPASREKGIILKLYEMAWREETAVCRQL